MPTPRIVPSSDAQRVMYGMTFTITAEPHEFIPCPWVANEFCRVCGLHQMDGQHMAKKGGR